jgi:hypothetical protein
MMQRERTLRRAAAALRPLKLLWPAALRRAVGAEHDSVLFDVLHTAYDRGGWRAALGQWLYEAGDVLATALRVQPAPMRRNLVSACLVTATVLLVLVPGMRGAAAPEGVVVYARDPAGEFSLVFRHGMVVSATVDRVPYPPANLVQTADSVRVLDAAGRTLVAVHIETPGTIRWNARTGE